MITFSRLIELSGLKPMLLEALTPRDAAKIFKFYGATDADLENQVALKKAYRRLILANHPDKIGDNGTEAAAEINSAFDTLKASIGGGFSRKDDGFGRKQQDEDPFPVWAQAGGRSQGHISRRDYHDVNFIKKTMWEMSNHSHVAWTIHAFDGYFFRGMYTAYGSPEIFDEMAKAMIVWESRSQKTRAVFASKDSDASKTLMLIYSDGVFHHPPIEMEHDSFNLNPGNDQSFVRRLPEMLDRIKAGDFNQTSS